METSAVIRRPRVRPPKISSSGVRRPIVRQVTPFSRFPAPADNYHRFLRPLGGRTPGFSSDPRGNRPGWNIIEEKRKRVEKRRGKWGRKSE